MRRRVGYAVVFGLLATVPIPAGAQVIGTFSWQTQPYCNVVTVTAVQHGGIYQLTGTDNLCGSGPAPATGTAVPAGSGVRLGLAVALPSGRTAHLSAEISLATASGTWADDNGRTGSFVFGGTLAGSPRPGPSSAPRLSTIVYFGNTQSAGGNILSPVKLRDLGTFSSTGGALRLTWVGHTMNTPSSSFAGCNFQLRIDGLPAGPVDGNGLVGDEAVVTASTLNIVFGLSTLTPWFRSVGAGTHTVELWVRSVAAICADNPQNYSRTVTIEEYVP